MGKEWPSPFTFIIYKYKSRASSYHSSYRNMIPNMNPRKKVNNPRRL